MLGCAMHELLLWTARHWIDHIKLAKLMEDVGWATNDTELDNLTRSMKKMFTDACNESMPRRLPNGTNKNQHTGGQLKSPLSGIYANQQDESGV
jgi:hypothetical protein